MKSKRIAGIVQDANKAYCSTDIRVAYMRKNPKASFEDIHDNWILHKTADGWAYGEYESTVCKIHPHLVDYSKLPEEQKVKDRIFVAIIRIMLGAE